MASLRIRTIAALAALWMLISGAATAQVKLPLHFSTLSTDDGLSRGYITAMLQDRDGFFWIGTSAGLNRYDGYSFRIFLHNAADSSSLAGNDISCLYEDTQRRLWIGTRDQGLDLYDRRRMRFTHLSPQLPSGTVRSIAEDSSSAVYAVTARGIVRITTANGSALKTNFINLPPGFEDAYFLKELKLFTERDGALRIASRKQIARLQWDAHTAGASYTIEHDFSAMQGFRISQISYDRRDDALIIFSGDSILRCGATPGEKRFQVLTVTDHRNEDFYLDEHTHCLWYSSAHTVCRMNLDSREIHRIEGIEPEASQTLQSALRFYTDRGHNLWIGSSGYGLLRYSPVQEVFHHTLPGCNAYCITPCSASGFCVNAMQRVSISRSGSERIDTVAPQRAFSKEPQNRQLRFNVSLDSDRFCFLIPGGIGIYKPGAKKLERYMFEQVTHILPPTQLYYDGKCTVWSAYGASLLRFDLVTHRFRQWPLPLKPDVLSLQFVHCFWEDSARRILWIGTAAGLFSFDEAAAFWKVYRYNAATATYPPEDAVYALSPDPADDNYLWIGMAGRGLVHFNKATGSAHPATAFNAALTDGTIYNILPYALRGQLWISTNSGLYCYTPASGAWRAYTKADGLQGSEFNRYAACVTASGAMVFGGLHGVNYFYPDAVQPLSPPPVFVTGLRIYNKPVDPSDSAAPLHEDIAYASALRLSYRQAMISFSFAAPDFRQPGALRYRYRLQGLDTGWVVAGDAHEATYTNLDPGTYHFSVQARYANGIWGKPSKPLTVLIAPPWWRAWWALMLLLLLVSAIVYGIHRFRMAQLMKVQRMRDNIARDLHDDIGSMLSTLSIYARVAQQGVEEGPQRAAPMLQKITDNAAKVMEAMNDIIWSINVRPDDYTSLMSRMREHAAELFDALPTALHLHFDEDVHDSLRHHLPVEKWKDFYLLYKEALNNVAKYAAAPAVWITLARDEAQHLLLTIRDDGQGFDAANMRRQGNGLKNMAARAKAIDGELRIKSALGEGTVLMLRV